MHEGIALFAFCFNYIQLDQNKFVRLLGNPITCIAGINLNINTRVVVENAYANLITSV